MNANVKKVAIAATTAVVFAVISVAMVGNASADGMKKKALHSAAPPPPPFGYYSGEWPVVLDFAQAGAWSLAHPYYTRGLYDYCDYRNCTLRRQSDGSWAPVWYGPPN